MLIDWIPIENFVAETYRTKPVQKIVDEWNVDPAQMVGILARYFKEMGIFKVSHVNSRIVVRTLMRTLRTSPEIHALVKKGRRVPTA